MAKTTALLATALLLAACLPEQSVQLARLLGTRTAAEKEADLYAKRSLELLDQALALRDKGDAMAGVPFLERAADRRFEASARYTSDCALKNTNACDKLAALTAAWDLRLPAPK